MVLQNRFAPLASQALRSYSLQFHRHQILTTKQKVFWFSISFAVVPACVWAYFFYKRAEHKRLEHEAEFGKPFFKPFPRDIKPFPWGDGQTPFFTTMKRYWGFESKEEE